MRRRQAQGSGEDARAVLFLSGDDSSSTGGAVLQADGGRVYLLAGPGAWG